jgi:hypothetical protein
MREEVITMLMSYDNRYFPTSTATQSNVVGCPAQMSNELVGGNA